MIPKHPPYRIQLDAQSRPSVKPESAQLRKSAKSTFAPRSVARKRRSGTCGRKRKVFVAVSPLAPPKQAVLSRPARSIPISGMPMADLLRFGSRSDENLSFSANFKLGLSNHTIIAVLKLHLFR